MLLLFVGLLTASGVIEIRTYDFTNQAECAEMSELVKQENTGVIFSVCGEVK
jgi:hypothetical protein